MSEPRDTRLWIAILTGPTIWLLSLLANFAVAPWACTLGWKPALFAVSLAALAFTAAAGFYAWKSWRQVGSDMPGETAGLIARERSLGLAGVALNAMFALVILAQAVPNIILRACE